ncbi:MAG TPA: HTTM domain-containing protein [Prosthecobacter sp.]
MRRFIKALFAPVDIASLVWFRIVFGIILLVEALRFITKGWIEAYYVAPAFLFKYYGFSWVQPWPAWGMHLHFWVLAVAGAGIALGFFYRICCAVYFLGFTYVFLLDQTHYLNHHYLVCLLCFLMIWMPAHHALSVDAWLRPGLRTSYVPAWPTGLLRAQLCIVYFMAGLAKLNGDWLAGEPMRAWLLRRTGYPVLGPYFAEPWMPYFFSYSGLVFDLLVVPMLIWRRTRLLAFFLAAVFNLTNCYLFKIGIFPWMALGATILLFQPRLPHLFPVLWQPVQGVAKAPSASAERQKIIATLAAVYITLQLLIPFRHWLYPGNVAWTEEGHRFSWRMMLRRKAGALSIHVRNPATNESWTVLPHDYLTTRQSSKASTRPDMILQLCHHVAADLAARGLPGMEVRALSTVSLNGRPARFMIDPEANLAAEPRTLAPAAWISPFQNDPIPKFAQPPKVANPPSEMTE